MLLTKKDVMKGSISVALYIYGITLAQREFTKYLQKQNTLTKDHHESE